MSKVIIFDGNFFLHRAWSVASKHRDPKELKKNSLTSFLNSVCTLSKERRATHVLVVFDSGRSFRNDIYPKYKANRGKEKSVTIVKADGTEYKTEVTAGSLVRDAKKIMTLSGITYSQVNGYEGDDLFACSINSLQDLEDARIIIEGHTRDKDMLSLIRENVKIYRPIEKQLMDSDAVFKEWGVLPRQMRDMLCLVGDKVDNIPGIPGWGPKTAAKFLNTYSSIKKALDNKEGRKALLPYLDIIQLSRALVTLKKDIHYELKDLIIQDFENELTEYVWKIPDALKDLGDVRKAASIRGLFRKR